MVGWYNSKKMKKAHETSENADAKPSATLIKLVQTACKDLSDEELAKMFKSHHNPSSSLSATAATVEPEEEEDDDGAKKKSPPPLTATDESVIADVSVSAATEALVKTLVDRHKMLSYFNEDVCNSLDNRNHQLSYDDIVREVNENNKSDGGPVILYPRLRAGMDESEKKQRYEVEEVCKIFFRQLHQHEKKRLPEFTNDESWLAMLQHWTDRWDAYPLYGCLITASNAPSFHFQYLHLKKLQRWQGHKNLFDYVPDLVAKAKDEEDCCWPKEYFDFQRALSRIANEKKVTGGNKSSSSSSCYGRNHGGYYDSGMSSSWNHWNSSGRTY